VNLDFVADTSLYASDTLPAAPPALTDPALPEPPRVRLGIVPPGLGFTYQSAPLLTLPEPAAPFAALATVAAPAALARATRRGRAG